MRSVANFPIPEMLKGVFAIQNVATATLGKLIHVNKIDTLSFKKKQENSYVL